MTDLRRRLERAERLNRDLQSRISNLQYIEDENKDKTPKRISQKLVEMGIVTETQMKNVLHEYCIEVCGRNCFVHHPSYHKLRNILSSISRRLSRGKRNHDRRYPPLRRWDRGNLYYNDEFERFGNDVILGYLAERPIANWEIDWDWTPVLGYNDPYKPITI